MPETVTFDAEKFKRLVIMAKNDAMMMEAYTRHDPIGDTTEDHRCDVEDDMALVNEAAAACGMAQIFAV